MVVNRLSTVLSLGCQQEGAEEVMEEEVMAERGTFLPI